MRLRIRWKLYLHLYLVTYREVGIDFEDFEFDGNFIFIFIWSLIFEVIRSNESRVHIRSRIRQLMHFRLLCHV